MVVGAVGSPLDVSEEGSHSSHPLVVVGSCLGHAHTGLRAGHWDSWEQGNVLGAHRAGGPVAAYVGTSVGCGGEPSGLGPSPEGWSGRVESCGGTGHMSGGVVHILGIIAWSYPMWLLRWWTDDLHHRRGAIGVWGRRLAAATFTCGNKSHDGHMIYTKFLADTCLSVCAAVLVTQLLPQKQLGEGLCGTGKQARAADRQDRTGSVCCGYKDNKLGVRHPELSCWHASVETGLHVCNRKS